MATDALANIKAAHRQQADQRQQATDARDRNARLWNAWQDLHGRNIERYRDLTGAKDGGWGFTKKVPAKYFAWEADAVLVICEVLKDDGWPIGEVQDDGDDAKHVALDIFAAAMKPSKEKLRKLLASVCVYRTDEELPEIGVSPVPDDDPYRKVHWWLRIGIRDELLGRNQAVDGLPQSLEQAVADPPDDDSPAWRRFMFERQYKRDHPAYDSRKDTDDMVAAYGTCHSDDEQARLKQFQDARCKYRDYR